jgi:TatD DNase family protein
MSDLSTFDFRLSDYGDQLSLVDTHCHIHDSEFMEKYDKSIDDLLRETSEAGVKKLLCVGTDVRSSVEALAFVQDKSNCFAAVALHPHEAEGRTFEQLKSELAVLEKLVEENKGKQLVAIGECGLDYYYHETEEIKKRQQDVFRLHLDMAEKYDLPLIFHVRSSKGSTTEIGDAFADFFKLLDNYPKARGVVHSFSATNRELEGILGRGLYVGLNGIMTFTRQDEQLEAAKLVPLEKLLLETDAPFLTPAPYRGKMCEPKHIALTAQFLSELRAEKLEHLARETTKNAEELFGI